MDAADVHLWGDVLSETCLVDDLAWTFHVWFGNVNGGLAMGTIGLMVLISAMNGLVSGRDGYRGDGSHCLNFLRRGYNKLMVTGVVQAGLRSAFWSWSSASLCCMR